MLERIITALVLVAVVLSCMFATQSQYPMFMLMIVAAGVAGYEWFKLMPKEKNKLTKPLAWGYGVVTAALSALALYFNDIALLLWVASILSWILSVFWVKLSKLRWLVQSDLERSGFRFNFCCCNRNFFCLAYFALVADVPVSTGMGCRQRCLFCWT